MGDTEGLVFRESVRSEPGHRILQRLFWWGLWQAQFADGFGGVEEHFASRHAHASERGFGWFAGKAGNRLVHLRGGPSYRVGNAHSRRADAGDFFQDRKSFAHGPVPFHMTENIAFADATFLRGKNVTDGDITDVHPVQTGVEIGGH